MEGNLSAAPRLACDYYKSYCWASDPPLEGEAQAYSTAENADLQFFNDDEASDPQPIGQAKSNDSADNKDLPTFNNKLASDPVKEGQVKPNDTVVQEDVQDFSKAVNGDLLLATELHLPNEYRSNNQGGIAISDLNVHFLVALCGMHICNQQDISLLHGGLRQFAAFESFEGHAPPSQNLQAALSFITASPAAHSKASPSAFTSSSLAIPVLSPLQMVNPPSSTTMPAIPALIPIHAATPHPRRSIDDLQTSSSMSIPFTTLASNSCSSPLRAQASPWMPNKPSLPSLLVGDIPLLPMSMSPKPSHPLLLPITARQCLASHHPVETLGFEQPKCCFHCGHSMDSIGCGSTTTIPFGFSPLRGRNGTNQAQESKAAVHHHGIDLVRHSNRPRCKMKAELKGFRIQKSTLDPG